MKDNKYAILIDNVYCVSATPGGQARYRAAKIEPFEGEYKCHECGFMVQSVTKKQATLMMCSLKSELQSIVDEYEKTMKVSSTNDNW